MIPPFSDPGFPPLRAERGRLTGPLSFGGEVGRIRRNSRPDPAGNHPAAGSRLFSPLPSKIWFVSWERGTVQKRVPKG